MASHPAHRFYMIQGSTQEQGQRPFSPCHGHRARDSASEHRKRGSSRQWRSRHRHTAERHTRRDLSKGNTTQVSDRKCTYGRDLRPQPPGTMRCPPPSGQRRIDMLAGLHLQIYLLPGPRPSATSNSCVIYCTLVHVPVSTLPPLRSAGTDLRGERLAGEVLRGRRARRRGRRNLAVPVARSFRLHHVMCRSRRWNGRFASRPPECLNANRPMAPGTAVQMGPLPAQRRETCATLSQHLSYLDLPCPSLIHVRWISQDAKPTDGRGRPTAGPSQLSSRSAEAGLIQAATLELTAACLGVAQQRRWATYGVVRPFVPCILSFGSG
jgi:hypothetical protein